jgi:hypothetical protein
MSSIQKGHPVMERTPARLAVAYVHLLHAGEERAACRLLETAPDEVLRAMVGALGILAAHLARNRPDGHVLLEGLVLHLAGVTP